MINEYSMGCDKRAEESMSKETDQREESDNGGSGTGSVTTNTKAKRDAAKRTKAEASQKKLSQGDVINSLSSPAGESVKDAATPKATSSQEAKEAKGKLVELLYKDISPLFEIKRAPGKGVGMFALQLIKNGTVILMESLLIEGSNEWLLKEANFMALSNDKKNRFLAMRSRCHCGRSPCTETTVMKIYDTNSYGIPADCHEQGCGQAYLYEVAARMNHSCVPNTRRGYTSNFDIIFQASKDIKAGEEITNSYEATLISGPALSRRPHILRVFGFICRCLACSAKKNVALNGAFNPWMELDEMKKLEKDGINTKILNAPTEEDTKKRKEVTEWFETFSLWIDSTCETMIQKVETKLIIEWSIHGLRRFAEYRSLLLKAFPKAVELYLKMNNKFKLKDDVVVKFMARRKSTLQSKMEEEIGKLESLLTQSSNKECELASK